MDLEELVNANCENHPSGTPVLTPEEVSSYLSLVEGWQLSDDGSSIVKRLRFEGFTEAAAFLARFGPMADEQDHHPDVHLTQYRWLQFVFTTHSIGGLSRNDFIMAAKLDRLYSDQT